MHTIIITARAHADHRVDVALTFADSTDAEAGTTGELYTLYQSIQKRLGQLETQGHATRQFQLPSPLAVEWGRALADALPGPVVRLLYRHLQRKPVRQLDLALVLESSEGGSARWLHRLPWELLLLPDRQIPVALEPHVAMYRRLKGSTNDIRPAAGPLRVVFAVSAPNQLADRPGEALDWAQEQAWMEAALPPPGARLVPADEGNLEYIESLVQQVSPHVLHLSGHGTSSKLQMEDLLGLPAPVGRDGFKKFCTKLPDSLRLVVLSQCQSGSPEMPDVGQKPTGEAPGTGAAVDDVQSERDTFISFADYAAEVRGMAVGMQFPVGDQVAAWWARSFYGALEKGSTVPRAVAEARQEIVSQLNKIRERTGTTGGFTGTEWVTPVLYIAGDPIQLVDHSEAANQAANPWVYELPPSLDDLERHRGPTAFVGRRSERRRLRRAVFGHRDGHRDETPVVGIVIRGLGGMGKSTLAAHLLEMLIDRARTPHGKSWRYVPVSGRLDFLDLAVRLRKKTSRLQGMNQERQALPSSRKAWKGEDDDLVEKLLDCFSALVEQNHRLALVFDDFEANLASVDSGTGGADHDRADQLGIADQQVRTFLEDLVEIALGAGFNLLLLIFTCRYPVPLGPEANTQSQGPIRWLDLPLGPLGQGEEQHLIRRLSIDDGAFRSQLDLLLKGYAGAMPGHGGHPRSLEAAVVAAAARMDSSLSAEHQSQLEKVRNWLPKKLLEQVEKKARARPPHFATDIMDLAAREAAVPDLLEDLPHEERSLVAGLAIFAAPFTSQAAYAVAHALEQPPDQVSARFDHLKRLGLIAPARQLSARPRDESGEERPPHRLWLVPTLVSNQLPDRQDQLQPAALGAIHAAAARHLAWRETQEELSGEGLLTLDRIVVVHAIRGAAWSLALRSVLRVLNDASHAGYWQHGCDLGMDFLAELENVPEKTTTGWRQSRAAVAFRLSTLLNSLGKPAEAQQQLDAAWSTLVPEQHQRQPEAWIDSLIRKLETQTDEARGILNATAGLLYELGTIDLAQGRYDEARERLEQTLKIAEKLEELDNYCASLLELAKIDQYSGRYAEARERLERSLEIPVEQRDLRGYGARLHALASIDRAQGRYDEARERLEQFLEISEKLEDWRGYGASLHELATIDHAQGCYDEARERLERSLEITKKLGDQRGYGASLHELASIDQDQGHYDEARERLEQFLEISEKLEDQRGYSASLHALAINDHAQGRYDSARERLEQSLEIQKKIGNQNGIAATMTMLGQQLVASDPARALRLLETALSIFTSQGSGEVDKVRGVVQSTCARLVRALPEAEQIEDKAERAYMLWLRGWAHRLLGELDQVRDDLETARELNREAGREGGERACDDQLSMLDEEGYHHWGDALGSTARLPASAGEALDVAEAFLEQDRVEAVLAVLMNWQPRSGAPSVDEVDHLLARVQALGVDLRERSESQLDAGQLDLALGEFLTELGGREEATKHLVAAEEAMTGSGDVAGALHASLARSRNLPAPDGIKLAEACIIRAERAGLEAEARKATRVLETLSTVSDIGTETGEEESP